jgi:branched-chain amino acid transport system ATP-binding protein
MGAPAMNETLLRIENLTKRFGGFTALDGVSLDVSAGERLGLIGPNGSGKTTLISCVAGTLPTDGGRIVFKGTVLGRMPAYRRTRRGIARSYQVPKPFASMTVLENVAVPLEYAGRGGGGDVAARALEILGSVGLGDKADENSLSLTQIELRKLELARALAAEPELLIADEVMAGLSNAEVDEVLELLFAFNGRGIAVIMIEHIMRAVMRFSQRIVVLDAGTLIAEGTPDEILKNPDVERAYFGE